MTDEKDACRPGRQFQEALSILSPNVHKESDYTAARSSSQWNSRCAAHRDAIWLYNVRYTERMPVSPLHIVFAGTPAFAVPSLNALATDRSFIVDLVITQPDRRAGRGKALQPPPVKIVAEHHRMPVWQPEDLNREFPMSDARRLNPDFLVVVAYGQILGRSLLEWPRIAPVNLHASLLPRWRGASPVAHAILSGDSVTGVTLLKMTAELDAGPIISSREVRILPREKAPDLLQRLAETGARLLTETLGNSLVTKAQDESAATFCRKLSRRDGDVEPDAMTAEEIDRRVRALIPWPGVRCTVKGHSLKLIETSLGETPLSIPLRAKDGTVLYLVIVQSPGKHAMTGQEWLRGLR